MAIRNDQIEDKAKKIPAEEPANPGAGSGIWYADEVLGTTEGFYKDSTGVAVQVTKNGGLNVPPFAYSLNVKEEGTSVDANVNEINFVGTGVTATQTAAGKVNVTISPGEANTGSNVGTGQGNVFKQKVGVDFQHRTIKAGSNVSVVEGTDEITISAANPSGEVNTASNVGGGNGLFKQKSGVDLQFRSIIAGTNVSITSGTDTITINSSGGGGGGSLSVKDEGSIVDTSVIGMDFVGAGVTTTQTSSGQVQVSIPGTTALTVKDEGANVTTSANTLNFTGAGVTASLASPGVVNVAISGSGGSSVSVQDEGSTVEAALTTLNFVGAGVTATSSSGTATITIPSGSGETNTASNVGGGNGIFKQKTGVDLELKTLVAGANVTLTPGVSTITIAATAGSGMDTATIQLASKKVLVRASGSSAALAAITATKSFTGTESIVTLGGLTGVILHSVIVRFDSSETTGRSIVNLVYPEPFGETDLYVSVRPTATKLIATDAASYLNTNASNSSGTMTITGSGFTAGQTYGAIFTF